MGRPVFQGWVLRLVLCSPAVDEKTDGCEDSAWNHDRHAEFWGSYAAGSGFEFAKGDVEHGTTDLGAQELGDADGYVVQTAAGWIEVVLLNPEIGV